MMPRILQGLIWLVAIEFVRLGPAPSPACAAVSEPGAAWPAGTEIVSFENLEGVMLLEAMLVGVDGRDTTGLLALDTGAGFLALDPTVAFALGLCETLPDRNEIEIADHPLSRLEIGKLQMDQLSPVITVDIDVVRRVTDRPVLGLLGERPLASRLVLIDYQEGRAALIPGTAGEDGELGARRAIPDGEAPAEEGAVAASRSALGEHFSANAAAVPFRLEGDGKILVPLRVSNPEAPRYSDSLTMILDTGATKCVFFEEALGKRAPQSIHWSSLRGLVAPTLVGVSNAHLVRVPSLEIAAPGAGAPLAGIDAAVLTSPLAGVLSRAVGEPVDGLLGYSFLKRHRVAIDYRHRVLWLDPLPRHVWDDQPYEYSHVGLQLERRGSAARVMAVAVPSPAASVGIERGDEVLSIDGRSAAKADVIELTRMMEGPPGTAIELVVRRGSVEKSYRLVRQRLL